MWLSWPLRVPSSELPSLASMARIWSFRTSRTAAGSIGHGRCARLKWSSRWVVVSTGRFIRFS